MSLYSSIYLYLVFHLFFPGKETTKVMRFLLACTIATGRIVFFSGPSPGTSSELDVIFESVYLEERLPYEWSVTSGKFKGMSSSS